MTTILEFFRGESWQKLRNLTLSEDDSMVGGVCGAFGKVTPFAPWMWRLLFCTTVFLWGIGLGTYLILWICIPGEKV